MPRIHRTGAAPTSAGGPPTGAAGGDLEGSEYPNPLIAAGKVTEGKLAAEAVTAGKLKTDAVETAKIKEKAVTKVKLATAVQEELEPKVLERTWAISGEVKAEEYPGFYVRLGTGEEKKIVGAELRLLEGTSCTVEWRKAKAEIAEYKTLEVKSTEAKAVTNTKALAAGDLITLKVTAVSGAPKGLTATLFVESVK